MRKLILFVFVSVCLTSYVNCGIIDDAIYGAIKAIVDTRYKGKSNDERKCIAETLTNDLFKDKEYNRGILYEHSKLEKELEDSFSFAETKCEWIAFLTSPLGICVAIGIVLMIISLLCGIIKCCCC